MRSMASRLTLRFGQTEISPFLEILKSDPEVSAASIEELTRKHISDSLSSGSTYKASLPSCSLRGSLGGVPAHILRRLTPFWCCMRPPSIAIMAMGLQRNQRRRFLASPQYRQRDIHLRCWDLDIAAKLTSTMFIRSGGLWVPLAPLLTREGR